MVLNKIFGAVLFIAGLYLLFVLYLKKTDYTIFTFNLVAGTLLVYFGLKLMGFV